MTIFTKTIHIEGDLRDKYLAAGIGTYNRTGNWGNYVWTKQ